MTSLANQTAPLAPRRHKNMLILQPQKQSPRAQEGRLPGNWVEKLKTAALNPRQSPAT
jgi:hypothetical protein